MDPLQQRSASNDQFVLTWNDVELAFLQHNVPVLQHFQEASDSSPSTGRIALYCQLTPRIEDEDFRIERLEHTFEAPLMLR